MCRQSSEPPLNVLLTSASPVHAVWLVNFIKKYFKCHSNLSFACACCFACQLHQKIFLAACAVGIVLLALLFSFVLDPARNCCTHVWRK
jgi:hypothetical protein